MVIRDIKLYSGGINLELSTTWNSNVVIENVTISGATTGIQVVAQSSDLDFEVQVSNSVFINCTDGIVLPSTAKMRVVVENNTFTNTDAARAVHLNSLNCEIRNNEVQFLYYPLK